MTDQFDPPTCPDCRCHTGDQQEFINKAVTWGYTVDWAVAILSQMAVQEANWLLKAGAFEPPSLPSYEHAIGTIIDGVLVQPWTPPGFDMETLNRLLETWAAIPPPPPIKLTREQLEEVKQTVPTVSLDNVTAMMMAFTGVPVEIVDDVTESTPHLRQRESLTRLLALRRSL